MKKQNNKFGTYEKGLIITGIAVLIIFLILLTADGIKNIGKNKQNLALSEQEIVVPPNVPVLSAGMIPVKYEGDNLIICKNDNSWYNYEAGKPAYMMLNDGVYQSELVVDMTNKKLASENIGQVVAKEEQGSIYMWIPRFEINSEDKIKYVRNVNYEDDGYEIPEMFTYKQEIETSPDFLLTGIWIEKEPLANVNEVTSKITNMTGENNTYGFIANTVGVAMTEEDKTIIGRAMLAPTSADSSLTQGSQDGADLPLLSKGGGTTVPEGSITDPSNTNRTTLKILNDKYQDPIKAKVEYNKTTGLIETTVTYSKYGINKITFEDTTELQMTNTNGIITATTAGITLEPGTYKITITDKNGTSKRLKVRVPLEYGREVLGYECDVPNVKWRLFHADDNNIYLIADDYIPYANLPTSTKGTALNKGNTEYKADFRTILNDYTGSSWIRENTNQKAQKWLGKYLSAYPDSTNNNMKAVAYMMDTESWNSFAGEKAEYAIGGPTLELFCASYKETHPDRYIECNSVYDNGYQVKWSDSSYDFYVYVLTQDEYNSIYIKSSRTNASGMKLASPSAFDANNLFTGIYNGAVSTPDYAHNDFGFRPVVCLKSGTKLIDNGDNTYSVKEPIMANIEYKEIDGTIEITVKYTENGIAKIEDQNGNSINYTNENGKIKAVTPAVGGKNKFIITDKKGITKELETGVVLPVYVTLYKDNTDETNITLAFTATDRVLEGKTVIASYGDIANSTYTVYNQRPWNSQSGNITMVDIVDKIYPKSTAFWFMSFNNLTNINNISNLNTSNVTYMNFMFANCNRLTELDVSNFDTGNVTGMSGMFQNNNLTKLNVSNFDTSNVTNMSQMFYCCNRLIQLDLSSFNTRNVTDMQYMFGGCISLVELNLSSFDTSNVTNMYQMFCACSNLAELDLSSFDTSNVTNMYQMFCACSNLAELDLSSFNTSNVTDMNCMFNGCSNLTELDLSSFNTSNVIDMGQMFEQCRNLIELDLSSFNTKNATYMHRMFMECTNLTTIYVGENWNLATNRGSMFSGCGTSTTTRK